jgi:nucleoside phosphorylase
MPEEIAFVRSSLGDRRRRATPGDEIVYETGQLGRWRVALAATGDGERRAREVASALCAEMRARVLLAVGVAGALSADLAPGDLVIARRVVREGGGALSARARAIGAAARVVGARPGIVVTAARLADSVASKRRLHRLARAGDEGDGRDAAVVDLESWSYVAAAAARSVPWLVLRSVSDTAREALPALLNRSLDDGGAIRRGRVLFGLLGEPLALPRLLELRRRVGDCARRLGQAIAALAAQPAADGTFDGASAETSGEASGEISGEG